MSNLEVLEYSKEHTSELVWLVDSILPYALQTKEPFATRTLEFLQGVVVYLARCPHDEHNSDLLRTATVMAAEWLISCQIFNNGSLPLRYIFSREDVHDPGEAYMPEDVCPSQEPETPRPRGFNVIFNCTKTHRRTPPTPTSRLGARRMF